MTINIILKWLGISSLKLLLLESNKTISLFNKMIDNLNKLNQKLTQEEVNMIIKLDKLQQDLNLTKEVKLKNENIINNIKKIIE